jgi:hypothetical protein
MIALLAVAALLPGVRANAQDGWTENTTRKAVAVCVDQGSGVEAMIAGAQAAGWPAFEKKKLASGLEIYSSFNTRAPISNTSPFVALQVGLKIDIYPGMGRLRQQICNIGPPVAQKALLISELDATFPGFSSSPTQWVGVRGKNGEITQLKGVGATQLQQSINRLAVDEGLVWVELNEEQDALFGTVRLYQKLP